MSPWRHPLSALSLLAAALALAGPAHADQKRDQGRGQERDDDRSQRQRRQDTLSDSIRRIERATRGQVLSAERMQSDGRDINRIKVVDDSGRVRVYLDDPQSRSGNAPPTRDDDD
jgi:hypothetical protein